MVAFLEAIGISETHCSYLEFFNYLLTGYFVDDARKPMYELAEVLDNTITGGIDNLEAELGHEGVAVVEMINAITRANLPGFTPIGFAYRNVDFVKMVGTKIMLEIPYNELEKLQSPGHTAYPPGFYQR